MRKFVRTMRCAKYMGKGERQFNDGNYEKALEYYQRSLEYAHEDVDLLVLPWLMAGTFAKLDRYKEAKEYADKSLEWCEKLADLGESVEKVKVRVIEILKYIDDMEQQATGVNKA